LAKGPVALIGIASLALGILGFIFANHSFTMDAPSGTVNGSTFLGIEGNGWTWVMFAAAGLLLLLGSPIHWGAKSMAFIVGVVLVVGALIAISDGTDVLGVVATNNWTKLIMGAAGVALIVLSMMPRVGKRRGGAPMATRRERTVEDDDDRRRRFDRDADMEPARRDDIRTERVAAGRRDDEFRSEGTTGSVRRDEIVDERTSTGRRGDMGDEIVDERTSTGRRRDIGAESAADPRRDDRL